MKLKLLLLFCIFSLSVSAQQWIRNYGQGYLANWIIEDYDKGYILLGTKTINAGYGLVIKTDINGNVLWDKHIGKNQYNMFVNNVELTPDNGLIIAGTTTKYGNQQDAYILKLNACGELQWCSDVYTPTIGDDLGWKVKPTADSGYILLGELNEPDPKLRTNLFKFDSQGNLQWHQAYLPDSAAFDDDGYDVIADSSGFLVTAVVYYPDPNQGGGFERFYFIKSDTEGNKKWCCIYGKDDYYHGVPRTTMRDNSGSYYSFGFHDNNGSSSFSPSLVKILSTGLDSYNKNITTSSSIIETANWLNDTILILGGGGGNGNTTLNIMYKIDTLGNLIDSVHLTVTHSAYAIISTAKTFDDKFVSIANDHINNYSIILAYKVNSDLQWDSIYTRPFTYDSLCPHPIVSDTIDPDCNLVVNVEEPITDPQSHQMKLFPNPAKEKLNIVFSKYLLVSDQPLRLKPERSFINGNPMSEPGS